MKNKYTDSSFFQPINFIVLLSWMEYFETTKFECKFPLFIAEAQISYYFGFIAAVSTQNVLYLPQTAIDLKHN